MINNLELKLNGELPVTREDLFKLVSSWGRISNFETTEEIDISFCPKKECYPLENLDVSKIEDLSDIFNASPYNGDLSKWDVSNCIDMSQMFANSHFNNNSIKNWELNSCKKISAMFTSSQFKSIPPDFDFNIIKFADLVFYYNQEFKKVFNDCAPIPRLTNSFKEWYKENRSIIRDSDLTQNDLLDYFDDFKEFNNLNTNEI